MIKFKIFFLIISFLTAQSYQKPPHRRMLPPPVKKLPISLDPDFTHELRIPNQAFCDKMESQSLGPMKILPWWTDYCTRLREKQERKRLKNGEIDLSPYRRVLDKLKEYRLRQKNMPQA